MCLLIMFSSRVHFAMSLEWSGHGRQVTVFFLRVAAVVVIVVTLSPIVFAILHLSLVHIVVLGVVCGGLGMGPSVIGSCIVGLFVSEEASVSAESTDTSSSSSSSSVGMLAEFVWSSTSGVGDGVVTLLGDCLGMVSVR